jgi:uncharacterized protein (DUF427 family)
MAEAPSLRIEPSPRWVRGYVRPETVPIVDSKRVLVVYGARRQPTYFFPKADVRLDRLDDGMTWQLDDPQLKEHVAFEWKKVDTWFEEDEEVFAHPRDPHHRVDVMESSRHVHVEVGGVAVADTHRPRLLFETGLQTRYYLPKTDVRMDLLEPTTTSTQCPYKGNAVYWSVKVGDQVYPDIVWGYPFPLPECSKIQNLVAFYNEKVDLYVDGELQPTRR